MRYTLAHGTGNDFVVLADLDDSLDVPAELVRALCDRRRGLGADGVLRLGAGGDGADVFMDYRNGDGSVVEMCGNGVRVTAKHVVDHGLVVPDDGVVRVDTRAGVKPVRVVLDRDGRVEVATVDMGPPRHAPVDVPFEADEDVAAHDVEVDGTRVRLGVASMGNPHAVVPVEDVDEAPVTVLGPALETHPRFPQKVNAGFAQVLSPEAIRLRVWERGVGETQACGTGACAAVAVLQRLGAVGPRVDVHLPGGTLTVEHRDGGTVEMTGPAVEVAHGRLDEAWLAAVQTQGVPL
jgi:diaminopimelate epimerase